jgi:hypothetical protein
LWSIMILPRNSPGEAGENHITLQSKLEVFGRISGRCADQCTSVLSKNHASIIIIVEA